MTTIVRALSRVFTASQTSEAETAMVMIVFGLVGLVVSVLLANYGFENMLADYFF